VGILDAVPEEKHSPAFRYAITGIALVVVVALGLWWALRFHSERVAVGKFLMALSTGQPEQAYQIWKASPTYSYKDFLDDWGPGGYYGPVKSFRIKRTYEPPRSHNSVAITVEVSPYAPFPADDDVVQQGKTKEVVIWVDRYDGSLSFPP
jgi:hypothetical protein